MSEGGPGANIFADITRNGTIPVNRKKVLKTKKTAGNQSKEKKKGWGENIGGHLCLYTKNREKGAYGGHTLIAINHCP